MKTYPILPFSAANNPMGTVELNEVGEKIFANCNNVILSQITMRNDDGSEELVGFNAHPAALLARDGEDAKDSDSSDAAGSPDNPS